MFKKYIDDNSLNYTLYKPTNQKQIKETIKLIKQLNYVDNSNRANRSV